MPHRAADRGDGSHARPPERVAERVGVGHRRRAARGGGGAAAAASPRRVRKPRAPRGAETKRQGAQETVPAGSQGCVHQASSRRRSVGGALARRRARRARSNDARFGALARDRRRDVAGGGHARGGSAPTPRGVRGRRRSPGGAHAHARREALGVGGAPRAIGRDARRARRRERGRRTITTTRRRDGRRTRTRDGRARRGAPSRGGGGRGRRRRRCERARRRRRAGSRRRRGGANRRRRTRRAQSRRAVATRKSHRRRRRRTDASRRAAVPRGGGRGDGRGARDAGGIVGGDARGGMRVCRRCRGRAARVERNVAGGVRGGRHRRAATRRAGAETRGKDARGGGGVPIRVPARREGEMHRRGGPRTLVRRFRRGAENRRRAHRRGGGVPEGRTHAARDDRAPR